MKILFVITMICRMSDPVCNEVTAIDTQLQIAPPGVIVCGLALATPVTPSPDKYVKTRCELRDR